MLHLTDPHLFAEPDKCLRGINPRESLQTVLDHIRASAWPAELVVLTGDLIQNGSRAADERIFVLVDLLQMPTYCVPGNHDVREFMREELRASRYRYCPANVHQNWILIGIDSCLTGQARGRIAASELDRLASCLSGTDAEHALICLHHPPMSLGSAWLDAVGLENADEFLTTIEASGKVRAAIFGHAHQAFTAEYSNIKIIGTPSTCRQFTVHSDEFALDDNPPAYRRLELQADGSIDHELIWVQ